MNLLCSMSSERGEHVDTLAHNKSVITIVCNTHMDGPHHCKTSPTWLQPAGNPLAVCTC
jgi:hypothetical protein